MRTTLHVLIVLTALLPITPQAQNLGDPADLPFTLALEEVTQVNIPGLHSFAFGKVDDWWVVIGGRTNGLHGFFIATGFPEDKANTEVLLIHPENGTVLSYEVEDMNLPFGDALRSTNPQFAQDGEWLYITGGYGKDVASGEFKTFPVLTAVDLPLLKMKLLAGENPASAFRQTEVPQVKVCGGEMEKLGDWFYLVGGHEFSGLYNQNGPPQFTQAYTNEIRRFKITNTASSLAISEFSAHHDEANLHRRDFTLAPIIQSNGTEALCLYGGVFRPDEDLPFYNPIYISEDNIFEMDEGYEQLFSQYTCPAVPLFDSLDGSMNTLFFGGLSTHFWSNGLQYDNKVPFIKDIATFRRNADGTSQEFVMPLSFDELLGANMVFVPSENASHYPNEVLKLRAMSGPTFVGYLFGGIKAEIPNITPSSANQRMFKVYITPKPTVSATSAVATPSLQVFPNPFSNDDFLHIESVKSIHHFELMRMDGRVLAAKDIAELKNLLRTLPGGVYGLKYGGSDGAGVMKLVKQ
ncbi:MAG: hypothetical protein GC192_14165 [Bacteroidetes bacterium]|nr:hypothetical protein [Bacteroidota bacterium]